MKGKFKTIKTAIQFSSVLWLVACSSQSTIGDLESVDTDEVKEPAINQMSHQQVREQYQELLELVDDSYIKEQIERRISGVYMQEGDDKNSRANARAEKGYYRDAIASYKDILEKYPNSPDNAEVLYQLAKAYDLEGQTKNALKMLERLADRHPYYENMPEAYFRMGDIYFNTNRYAKAEYAYRKTVEGDAPKLLINAHYMLAWSQYKQGNYNKAMNNFAIVLAKLEEAVKLNNIEKALVKDTLHSMSLSLINLGGAQAIQDVAGLPGKSYSWKVYSDLADFYLEKSLYDDSAATFREYLKHNPESERASTFHSRMIQVYLDGSFPKLALDEKENYTNQYAPTTDYFKSYPNQQKEILKNLKQYYVELATHYHSQGQQALAEFGKNKKESHLQELGDKSLTQASDYYGRFLTHFNIENTTADIRYKKAEAQFQNKQYKQAAIDYDLTAYLPEKQQVNPRAGYKLANKAAYASIVSYQKYIDELAKQKSEDEAEYREIALASMLKFAQVFHKDKRSPSVLTNAAQQMFALNQYNRAINMATDLIRNIKGLSVELKKTAYGIIAQSYFKKGNYEFAKNSYVAQRKLSKAGSKDYKDASNNIAVALYKKAEIERNNQEQDMKPQAIATLLSIKTLAPNTETRIVAQYDAASLLLERKEWDKAIAELNDLKKSYPKHKLAAEFPRKLAFAHESKKDWKQALAAYTYLFKNDPDVSVRQEALFISAGLAEKNKNNKLAITYYKDYAHKYEQPFDNRMEARYHLADLYEKEKDMTKHLYWLRRVIAGDKKGGEQRSDRSRWLGAWANAKYGDYFAYEYKRRKLRAPINSSLTRKNKYIQDATSRYEAAAGYGILEFVSMSNFKIADMYDSFSEELTNAPIPKTASAEERGLYQQIFGEQAAQFSQLATTVYMNNIDLAWQGHFTKWIDKSFEAMRRLSPERFNREEAVARYGDEIR